MNNSSQKEVITAYLDRETHKWLGHIASQEHVSAYKSAIQIDKYLDEMIDSGMVTPNGTL